MAAQLTAKAMVEGRTAVAGNVSLGAVDARGLRVWASHPLLGVVRGLQAQALFIVAVCTVVALGLAEIPAHFSQDGWLALLAGRTVATGGIPYHDYFTHMAYGVQWVDQQWLAQLVMYELQRLGGMQLLTVVYVLLTGAAFAGAIAAARGLGGEGLHVLMAVPVGVFFYLATAVTIRTQGFAYPLFVATLWLLADDLRRNRQGKRVYWVFPMLLVWANLHGSVTLGVGLAGLYGVAVLLRRLRALRWRGLHHVRAWAFIVLSPLALLATPYGFGAIHYYHVTLLNPEFSKLITEWKPASSVPVLAVPLFVAVAAITVLVLWRPVRNWRQRAPVLPIYDAAVLAVLAYGAVTAVRNITWFGLAMVVLVPAAITRLRGGRPSPLRRARVNAIFAGLMLTIVVAATVAVVTRPGNWFTATEPARALPRLEGLLAHDRSTRVFADVRYADWLVWKDPRLFSGRIAYDTSLELLKPAQLWGIAHLSAPAERGPHGVLAPYAVWMLNPDDKSQNRRLLRVPGVHVVLRNAKVVLAVRTAEAHA